MICNHNKSNRDIYFKNFQFSNLLSIFIFHYQYFKRERGYEVLVIME